MWIGAQFNLWYISRNSAMFDNNDTSHEDDVVQVEPFCHPWLFNPWSQASVGQAMIVVGCLVGSTEHGINAAYNSWFILYAPVWAGVVVSTFSSIFRDISCTPQFLRTASHGRIPFNITNQHSSVILFSDAFHLAKITVFLLFWIAYWNHMFIYCETCRQSCHDWRNRQVVERVAATGVNSDLWLWTKLWKWKLFIYLLLFSLRNLNATVTFDCSMSLCHNAASFRWDTCGFGTEECWHPSTPISEYIIY